MHFGYETGDGISFSAGPRSCKLDKSSSRCMGDLHTCSLHTPFLPSLYTATELELFFTSTYQVRFDRYGAAKAGVAPSRVLGVPVELTVHGGCVC